MSNTRARKFLAAMGRAAPDEAPASVGGPAPTPAPANDPAWSAPAPEASGRRPQTRRPKAAPRTDLTHFGGYLDVETFEKIALLKLRLKMDNSTLIKQAIEDLYRKHSAKRAFGDA